MACHQWSFLWLHCGCCSHCFWWFWLVVEVASLFTAVASSFPTIAWFLWLVVAVALSFPEFALWLLRLILFPRLRCHFSLAVVVGCCICIISCICMVISCSCVMVVAVIVLCLAIVVDCLS